MNAVITGATKGIGRAIAFLFAKEGIHLAICSRSKDDLTKTKDDLLQINPNIEILILEADLSQEEEVLKFSNYISNTWDSIDILINNAGVFLPGEILKEEEGQLDVQIKTNLFSAYHLTRACMPLIEKSQKGHIFNMCSIASKIAYPNGGSYSISKFALYGFSKVLREELKPKGIKVSAVLPGATWSNSWAGVDLEKERLMEGNDIALAIWSAVQMSPSAVMEEIILRPQLGDL